ncbi:hypothetical protein HYW76_03190 [Candidatus Pacearchaeota archaeon]|nr:hypothetical protein [Candidatus Pacearchaeota archaeon]
MKKGVIICIVLLSIFFSLNLVLGIKYLTPSCQIITNEQECEQFFTGTGMNRVACIWNDPTTPCKPVSLAEYGATCEMITKDVPVEGKKICEGFYQSLNGQNYNCKTQNNLCVRGSSCQIGCTPAISPDSCLNSECPPGNLYPSSLAGNIVDGATDSCSTSACLGFFQRINNKLNFLECLPTLSLSCDTDYGGQNSQCTVTPSCSANEDKGRKTHSFEVCNGEDDNGNSQTDEEDLTGAKCDSSFGGYLWRYYDYDGDNYGIEGNGNKKCLCSSQDRFRALNLGDCNDNPQTNGMDINPGMQEICNDRLNNNCDIENKIDCQEDSCNNKECSVLSGLTARNGICLANKCSTISIHQSTLEISPARLAELEKIGINIEEYLSPIQISSESFLSITPKDDLICQTLVAINVLELAPSIIPDINVIFKIKDEEKAVKCTHDSSSGNQINYICSADFKPKEEWKRGDVLSCEVSLQSNTEATSLSNKVAVAKYIDYIFQKTGTARPYRQDYFQKAKEQYNYFLAHSSLNNHPSNIGKPIYFKKLVYDDSALRTLENSEGIAPELPALTGMGAIRGLCYKGEGLCISDSNANPNSEFNLETPSTGEIFSGTLSEFKSTHSKTTSPCPVSSSCYSLKPLHYTEETDEQNSQANPSKIILEAEQMKDQTKRLFSSNFNDKDDRIVFYHLAFLSFSIDWGIISLKLSDLTDYPQTYLHERLHGGSSKMTGLCDEYDYPLFTKQKSDYQKSWGAECPNKFPECCKSETNSPPTSACLIENSCRGFPYLDENLKDSDAKGGEILGYGPKFSIMGHPSLWQVQVIPTEASCPYRLGTCTSSGA